jgi:hypothetical protein
MMARDSGKSPAYAEQEQIKAIAQAQLAKTKEDLRKVME